LSANDGHISALIASIGSAYPECESSQGGVFMSVLGSVGLSGDARIDGLLSGWAWSVGTLGYSDPDSALDYGSGYRSDLDGDGLSAPRDGFARLSAGQLAAARSILDITSAARAGFAVEGFTGLGFAYAGAGSGAGDIRLARCADAPTAYAWMPGDGAGGDVWLGGAGLAPRAGNYDNLTLLHELGHALGLKHAHEAGGSGAVPAAYDSLEYTVMTYRPYAGGPANGYGFEAWGAPQSYMMLDIAALQQMYGADYSVNAGDTVYRWSPGSGRTLVDGGVGIDPGANRIFATIWDGGGKDTYDLSAYATAVSLDLRPGRYSVFSAAQLADLGGGPNGGHSRGNIFNALQVDGDARSLIENATGGSGNDGLLGNGAGNLLSGNAGNDRLAGFGGRDVLVGGKGADVFVFTSCGDSPAGACDRLAAGGGAVAFERPGNAAGDRIDLHGIDADATLAGNQAFAFGTAKTRGHLWLQESGSTTYVCGNVDGDAAIELHLAILDGGVRSSAYTAADFLL
jgi:serralysin